MLAKGDFIIVVRTGTHISDKRVNRDLGPKSMFRRACFGRTVGDSVQVAGLFGTILRMSRIDFVSKSRPIGILIPLSFGCLDVRFDKCVWQPGNVKNYSLSRDKVEATELI